VLWVLISSLPPHPIQNRRNKLLCGMANDSSPDLASLKALRLADLKAKQAAELKAADAALETFLNSAAQLGIPSEKLAEILKSSSSLAPLSATDAVTDSNAPNHPALTLRELIERYTTDERSSFQKKTYNARNASSGILFLLAKEHGDTTIAEIDREKFLEWDREWSRDGKNLSRGHAYVKILRVAAGFGASVLANEDCQRLRGLLNAAHIQKPPSREKRGVTTNQIVAFCREAHKKLKPSLALAQSMQYCLKLGQRDVAGEWVPMSEPGMSDIVDNRNSLKWLRGMRWEEIDGDMVFRRADFGWRKKPLEVDLRKFPMVMEEIARVPPERRKGPMVISEYNGSPWTESEFRRFWRIIADAAGIPKDIKNADTRFEVSEVSQPTVKRKGLK
jgi:hypothetical protein